MTQQICAGLGDKYNWDGSKCVDCSSFNISNCISTVCMVIENFCVGKTKENAKTISQCLSIS